MFANICLPMYIGCIPMYSLKVLVNYTVTSKRTYFMFLTCTHTQTRALTSSCSITQEALRARSLAIFNYCNYTYYTVKKYIIYLVSNIRSKNPSGHFRKPWLLLICSWSDTSQRKKMRYFILSYS